MRRGEVVWVDLDPARSGEANKRRPAVIVSNDGRLGRGVITVVPITTNTTRIYPFQVLLPATRCRLPADSKAQAEQIRAVSVERIGKRIGQLPADVVANLDAAIRLHLGL